jgi:hypothetical protein
MISHRKNAVIFLAVLCIISFGIGGRFATAEKPE